MRYPTHTKAGFTLIELLVVLTIVGLLIGLVGPLTIDSLNRAEARAERLKFINWLRFLSHEAYLKARPMVLKLDGKSATLSWTEGASDTANFDYLFFGPQSLYFNENGFVSPDSVTISFNGQNQTLQLAALINNDDEQIK